LALQTLGLSEAWPWLERVFYKRWASPRPFPHRLVLRHDADMSFKEIASLTRVSINTALGRMRYALINIRKMMNEREVVLQ
jgi:DNA-directed RNA polymerase specialized sigma24 family protein